ncbi:MAG: porin family protein [Colwellia sp.]|nr:porin family protein [Colwellia sp.]
MKNLMLLTCTLVLLSFSFSSETYAKQTKRAGKWEGTFQFINSQSSDINSENGSGADLDNDLGWGFTFGYNVNPHILVNFGFTSITPRYDATLIGENGNSTNIKHKMNMYNSQFNVVYNFMTDQFTPFVQAGAGWSYLDSNIAKGPSGSVCWWDPWWGYYCDYYQNTHNDTRFSYNVAAGVRYELDNSMFFRASYQQNWTDVNYSSDLNVGMFHLEVGSLF